MSRAPYQAAPVSNPWWLSEEGIKTRAAEQREACNSRYVEELARINKEELAALAAFDQFKNDR